MWVTFVLVVGYVACNRLDHEGACSMKGERHVCDCASHHWTTLPVPGNHTMSYKTK